MKRFKSWRYKCEHCGKIGGSKYWMGIHETHCTANEDRWCRMCEPNSGGWKPDMSARVDALDDGGEAGMKNLRELTDGCPACILAALRQSGLMEPDPEPFSDHGPFRDPLAWESFDYQQEREAWLGAWQIEHQGY